MVKVINILSVALDGDAFLIFVSKIIDTLMIKLYASSFKIKNLIPAKDQKPNFCENNIIGSSYYFEIIYNIRRAFELVVRECLLQRYCPCRARVYGRRCELWRDDVQR